MKKNHTVNFKELLQRNFNLQLLEIFSGKIFFNFSKF